MAEHMYIMCEEIIGRGDTLKLNEYFEGLRGKRICVIGIGISNLPLIERLADLHIDVTALDRRTREELGETADALEAKGVSLKLGADYLDGLDADVIFRTPGIMPTNLNIVKAVKSGAALTSEMEAFFEVCPCDIIAVTGSDGKTTTTSIIAELLQRAGKTVHVGGNIGTPLLCSADKMNKDDIAVLELSSFQLITMKKSPKTAVITNLAPNHLNIHGSMQEYSDAKKNIFVHQGANSRAVFNLDNGHTREFAKEAKDEVMFFSMLEKPENGVFMENGAVFAVKAGKAEKLIDVADILIPGRHNIENYMAAFAAVSGLVDAETMLKTAREFGGVEHRIELVRTLNGVKYYNDSIASSPSRTIAGLKSFDQKVILIAGGRGKGVPFDGLGGEIMRHVKKLFLTGETAEMIKTAVEASPEYRGEPEVRVIDGFKETVIAASRAAEAGDIVILSPACTSFDRFKNFEERGHVFKDIVKGLE